MNTVAFKRADEIAETFALIKQVHPNKLALPAIQAISGRLISYPMREAILDSFGGEKINEALMDMLHHSKCPHVAAFIQVLSDQYEHENAQELDAYDEERGNV